MLVNKKLGRFKQWAGERMGGEIKTGVSDEFKALEVEMNLRHEGKIPSTYGALSQSADIYRYGQDAKVHDRLRQVAL